QPGHKTIRELFKLHGKRFSPEMAERILKKKEDHFKKHVKIRFIDGARTLLHCLYAQGFCLALVTGTARHEVNKILPARLRRYFNVIVTGNEVKHGKPHPEPYLKALKLLTLPAKKTVVIENAPFGIASAKRAGIKCFALQTSLPRCYLAQADEIFPSIKALRQKIQFVRDC
ncbi:MAG: HAD family hydrolase, partial [Candidatus Omnitrophota bacterium]|nr:HAD family hydrolase [Candidatus Omnitrophota bacterium]